MSDPHATHAEGMIWWRGSNPTFSFILPETAQRLLPRLLSDPATAYLAADLEQAIRDYEAYHKLEDAA